MKLQQILDFYEDARGLGSIDAIRAFLPTLFAAHSFEGFHLFTSHYELCISHFAHHEERAFAPLFSIVPHTAESLLFKLKVHRPTRPIFRAFTEQVVCPTERGLELFEDLFSRFRYERKPIDSPCQ